MNKILSAIAAIAAMLSLGSCQAEILEESTPEPSGIAGFTINATYGDQASRAAFDENGLDMYWTPGDVLYLIDPDGVNPRVALTTDISDSTTTAKFHTDELIAPGQYIVLYGQDDLNVTKDIQLKKSISDLDSQIRLYGNVEVALGQTDADVELHQLYAMLSFQFLNAPSGFSNLSLGMAVCSEGLKNLDKGTIGTDGLTTEYSGDFLTYLGYIDSYTAEDRARTLIAPVDLSWKQVIFFVTWNNGGSRSVRMFFKGGLDLQAGKAYNIKLDFDDEKCQKVDFKKSDGASVISNETEFLAAALLKSNNSFILQEDIRFTNGFFLPIKSSSLIGNGHTLSEIQCGLSNCSNVGVVSEGAVRDLNVNDSMFNGKDNVGAIVGNGYCTGCSCTHVIVAGTDKVGGIVGRGSGDIESNTLIGGVMTPSSVNGSGNVGGIVGYCTSEISNCIVTGKNSIMAGQGAVFGSNAGGIVGYAYDAVSGCCFEGAGDENTSYVTGGECSGGIAGYCENSVSKCIVRNGVVVSGSQDVGGITGRAKGGVSECGFEGSVSGSMDVGGVAGDGDCNECYGAGSVTGTNYVGGVAGICDKCIDCYFIGAIEARPVDHGGICGSSSDVTVANCYSCLNVSGSFQFGICISPDKEHLATNLTSIGALCYNMDSSLSGNCNCGPDGNGTFVSKLNVINGNSAYLNLCWPDNDYGCPILKWQYTGFGGDVTIPSFIQTDWTI